MKRHKKEGVINDEQISGRPANLSRYAELCLRVLNEHGLEHIVAIGGGVGLLHYLDYRSTHDIDMWWDNAATTTQKQRVLTVVQAALTTYGEVRQRAWGDVVSIELLQQGRSVFSFQVAQRSAQLRPAISVLWTSVYVDSLDDLVASKMVALVERGTPRDFRDIYAVCYASLMTPEGCWQLWEQRQQLSQSDTNHARARLAIEMHLQRIALQRPLEKIKDSAQREAATAVRKWFQEVLLNVS